MSSWNRGGYKAALATVFEKETSRTAAIEKIADHCEAEVAAAVWEALLAAGCKPSKNTCTGCRQSIYWITTAKGAKAPINRSGTSHFATCPEAHHFRRSANKGGES